jgi:hypothetical protein
MKEISVIRDKVIAEILVIFIVATVKVLQKELRV